MARGQRTAAFGPLRDQVETAASAGWVTGEPAWSRSFEKAGATRPSTIFQWPSSRCQIVSPRVRR